jgi:hypothetical protein
MLTKVREVEPIQIKKLAAVLEQAWGKANLPNVESWDRKFTIEQVTKHNKVSLVTTSMNRLSDVKQTLPRNIKDNEDYPNIEFVLLDYNSQDGLGDWVRFEMMDHVEKGTLVYYRTEEPEFYDMSHSRNVGFKAATGDIVNSVDADAFTNAGFATFVNRMANERPEKAIFAKSRQLLRGRLGFYRKEFIDLLGGYDGSLHGYGHDDQDILNRAWCLGFKMMRYGGQFSGGTDDHKKHQSGNYKELWWVTEGRNRFISYANLILERYKANEGEHWGKAKLMKNFKEEIEI